MPLHSLCQGGPWRDAYFCIYGTGHVVSDKYEDVLESTNDFWSSTNAFLLGELSDSKQQFGDYKQKTDDKIAGLNNQIMGLKEDDNKLTTELGNAQLQVAQLQTLPETAFMAYSNAQASLTLNEPHFDLWVNGQPLTNYLINFPTGARAVIILDTNRTIKITIYPDTPHMQSIKDLTVMFGTSMDTANFVSGKGGSWWNDTGGDYQQLGPSTTGIRPVGTLVEVAQSLTTEEQGFTCTPLVISKQYPQGILYTRLSITAPGLFGVQDALVNFIVR
jgi:hypothetical protein